MARFTSAALAARAVQKLIHTLETLLKKPLIPDPWAHAEVMEVYVTPDEAAGLQCPEMMLWSEDAGIDIRCGSIEIDAIQRSMSDGSATPGALGGRLD